MIIIVDSGSSKTTWSIVEDNNSTIIETIGLNPYHVSENQITETFKQVLEQTKATNIQSIKFYGAGCSNLNMQNKIKQALKSVSNNAKIDVYNDLLAAAHGLLQNEPGWIAILGTGSNAAYYDGTQLIKNTPSLGYILGDEGSGSYLGKELIKLIYYNQFPELKIKFEQFYNFSIDDILYKIYREPNAQKFLASFTYFINEYKNHIDIKNLIINAFNNFLTHHVLPFINQYPNKNIAFCGSVASIFSQELEFVCQKYNLNLIKVEKSPIKGLIDYYVK